MSTFKCKKCGGTIQFNPGDTIGVCDTCGMKQTLSELDFNNKANPLLRRVFMFLEDGDWQRADEYCEKVLDLDPENAEAYLGKLMAELHVRTREALKDHPEPFDNQSNYQKVLRFGDEKLKQQLAADVAFIKDRNKTAREKAARKHKRTIAIVTPIIIVCIAFVIVMITVIIPNRQYKETVDKYGNSIRAASIGDTMIFGHYEQDINSSNGKEEIEWIVLAKDGNRVLVISKYSLDCQRYNMSDSSVTWETCSLRKWLNSTFVDSAFNAGEQRLIQSSNVTADKNPSYSTFPGNDTTDKVFLLSIAEVDKYFSSYAARQCQGTAYCYARGANKPKYGNCGGWWLRSPGHSSSFAAQIGVDDGGFVDDWGAIVNCNSIAVRPAMWINLDFGN